jgi:hypothetical protein
VGLHDDDRHAHERYACTRNVPASKRHAIHISQPWQCDRNVNPAISRLRSAGCGWVQCQ